jgi:hypothetical protein
MHKNTQSPLTPPVPRAADKIKTTIERAMEIRQGSAKIREGKPLAFPNQRRRQT